MSAPQLPRLSAEDALNDIVGALDDSGAVVIEGLLDPDLLRRFNGELDPLLKGARPDHDRTFVNPAIAWFFGERTRHVTGIAGKSPVFAAEILTHPILTGVCDAELNLAHVLDRGPGGEAQILHRDELAWVHMPRPHPES